MACDSSSTLTSSPTSSLTFPNVPSSQNANQPSHLSKDIQTIVKDQQVYASTAFLSGDDARAQERQRQLELAAAAAKKAAEEEAARIEAAKVRKDPACPSYHGGFAEQALQMVPVGGGLIFAKSDASAELGAAPPLPKAKPATPAMDPTLPVATGDVGLGGADGAAEAANAQSAMADSASNLLASSLDKSRPAGGMTSVPPLSQKLSAPFAAEPPVLPPPAQRLNSRVPPRVDGSVRPSKVPAPTVSEQPAQANPNLLNLLLEVPYKRGVHTVSVNQRYLNHEPTFDAAFELMPAQASFGTLRAGCIYRFRMILVNVSNLPQRFVVKSPPGVKIVYTPGVAAPGLTVPMEVELYETAAGSVREIVTIVTEREEISIPVSATVLAPDEHEASNSPAPAAGVRMLAMAPRDPELGKTVPLTVRDVGAGTKRFQAPERKWEGTRPDFNAEGSDDEEAEMQLQ